MNLETLLNNDEAIAQIVISGEYVARHIIVPKDFSFRVDVAGCIEETLHRLIAAGADDSDILVTMGAIKEEEVDKDFYPEEEWISIDLGYVIPSPLLSVQKI